MDLDKNDKLNSLIVISNHDYTTLIDDNNSHQRNLQNHECLWVNII